MRIDQSPGQESQGGGAAHDGNCTRRRGIRNQGGPEARREAVKQSSVFEQGQTDTIDPYKMTIAMLILSESEC